MRTAIVIPALNEANTIASVIKPSSMYGSPIVVDDGSNDGTGEVAILAGAEVVRHRDRAGYDAALQSGFERAWKLGYDIVVTMDADGQHEPSLLPIILSPLISGEVDLVIGTRRKAARFSEALFGFYTQKRYSVPDILCGLKGYKIDLFKDHGRFDASRSIGTELALAALARGVKFRLVDVPIRSREGRARLGSRLRTEFMILRALTWALITDFCQIIYLRKRKMVTKSN